MYTYGRVERALAQVFNVRSERMGALRGRIKHFQRVGISMSSPGKGKKIEYSFENVFRWALALEFSEFGIDPTLIAKILAYLSWKSMDEVIFDDEYLVFYPEELSRPQVWTRPEGRHPCSWIKDANVLAEFVSREVIPDDVEQPNVYDRRFGVIHTGALLRRLKAALHASDEASST
jgi:hypothetical protein